MSFERPTLKTLISRIEDDTESRIGISQLRRSNANVFSRVLAGAVHGLYGFIEYINKQCFFDTAEDQYLDRWASIFGVKRKAATKASGTIKFSYSDEQVTVPSGTILQSEDSVRYKTTSAVDEDGVASIEAIEAGADGNQTAGDILSLASPIAGVLSEATIVGLAGGADAEDDESLRARLLSRARETPAGGSEADYVQWALEVAGVTRAWCFPEEDGEGTVTVRFVCDDASPIVPDETLLQHVKDYIDTKRPVTAHLSVEAPTLVEVPITISGLLPATDAVKEAVQAELEELFRQEAEPGIRVYLSHIRAAISAATGEEDHTLVSPTSDPIPASKSELLTLGEITWQ